MRAGAVVRYHYDPEQRALTGQVTGSAPHPYQVRVVFPARQMEGSAAFNSHCSCPVGYKCKHAVALMLTAIDRAAKTKRALTASSSTWRSGQQTPERDGQDLKNLGLVPASSLTSPEKEEAPSASALPAWRRALAHSLAARPSYQETETGVSAALDLRLVVPGRYGWRQEGGAPRISLEARPLMLGARGKWIKGGLSWEKFSAASNALASYGIRAEHARWLQDFYALIRSSQSLYSSHRDWASISQLASPLLWQMLDEAKQLGLSILLEGQETGLAIAPPPQVEVDLVAVPQRGSSRDALSLVPRLRWGPYSIPAQATHKLGSQRQGFIALAGAGQASYERAASEARWDSFLPSALAGLQEDPSDPADVQEKRERPAWLDSSVEVLLIPLGAPLDATAESLLQGQPITVPAADRQAFFEDYYPALTRSLPLVTSSPEVDLPQVRLPQLVLEVSFTSQEEPFEAQTHWYWEYPLSPTQPDSELVRFEALALPGQTQQELRDSRLEQKILSRVQAIRPGLPLTRHRSQNWATRTLVEDYLPAYQKLEGVRVEVTGPVPQFRELDQAPEIVVRVDETRKRDWFGLGVSIKAGDWYVAFSDVLAALAKNQTHLLLGNGQYFSLDRPEFLKLQELLREAQGLADKTGPLEINRQQVGLWQELEELAAQTETVETWRQQVEALLTLDQQAVAEPPVSLQANLRPYQLEGYQWLAFLQEHSLGGVLADDMGLGKTLQAIALMARTFEQDPAAAPFLVLAPTSVVPNWTAEIRRFAPELKVVEIDRSSRASGLNLAQQVAGAQVIVTSYALFRLEAENYQRLGQETPYSGLIMDEAQFLKNAKTKAHQAARDLEARSKIAMTGTPMENNLMELWAIFSLVAPGLFPSARTFKDHYATPIESGEETAALGRLRRRVRPLMKRRTKELVAADLPPKTDMRIDVPLAAAHRRAYDTHLQRERQKVLGLLADFDRNRFTIFQSLTTLRRLALDASLIDTEAYSQVPSSKLDYLEENLPEIIQDGHRVLVFSQFTSYLAKVAQRLDSLGLPYLYLDGTTRNRGQLLEDFEAGKAPIFLISLKAGGFGLNLTSADYCFIMDPWWNPAAEQQAVDRIHRIGQTKRVMVYRLVAAGTIEEKVMELKESKAALFDAVVDEGNFFSSQLTAAQIRDLLTAPDPEAGQGTVSGKAGE